MKFAPSTFRLISCTPLVAAALFAGCTTKSEDPAAPAGDSVAVPPALDPGPDAGVAAPSDASEPPFDCSQDSSVDAPMHLRCAGLYGDWSTKMIQGDVREYRPATTIWSDGAMKKRWVSLPFGTKIDTTDMDAWKFPVGTKFFKEFVVGGKHVETRMFSKVGATTWVRATYQWSEDELTATRLDTGYTKNGGDPDAGGYEIPALSKCDQCHNGSEDKVLGFEAVGLGAAGATGYTLAQLVADDKLTTNPTSTALTIPEDGHGSANALGWLHGNCGTSCHNRNPAATCNFKGMYLKLTYAQLTASAGSPSITSLDPYVTTHNVGASNPSGGYKRIAPGNVANSAVHFLASHRSNALNGQMPPIDTHVIDPTGVAFLETWIATLP